MGVTRSLTKPEDVFLPKTQQVKTLAAALCSSGRTEKITASGSGRMDPTFQSKELQYLKTR
jgi:hypothetical protein